MYLRVWIKINRCSLSFIFINWKLIAEKYISTETKISFVFKVSNWTIQVVTQIKKLISILNRCIYSFKCTRDTV